MSDEQVITAEEQKQDTQDASDKMTPEHPRFKEVLNRAKTAEEKTTQLEQELEALRQQVQERQANTGEKEFTDEEERALAKIEKGLASRGFVKKQDLDSETYQIRLEKELDRMTEKYDGSNGLAKFVADEVYAYAKKNGMEKNLEGAYKLMNYEANLEAEARRRSQGATPPRSERPTSQERIAANVDLTTSDVKNMSGEEWEKVRDKVLNGLR